MSIESTPYEHKLFIPRTVEGLPNTPELKTVRELEQVLKEYNWFVSIALYGSTAMGYVQESSDIDVVVLFDSSLVFDADADRLSEDVMDILEQLCEATRAHGGREIHYDAYDLNIVAFREELEYAIAENELNEEGLGVLEYTLGAVCRLTTGTAIQVYRAALVELLATYPAEVRTLLHQRVVRYLQEAETASLEKLFQRVPHAAERKQEITTARQLLWKQRVASVLGYTAE